MQKELIDAFDQADKDDNVRAIIVTGAGAGSAPAPIFPPAPTTFDRDARRGPVKRLASARSITATECAGRWWSGHAAHLQMLEGR